MKERFRTADWERLQRLPIVMFQFVSLVDGEMHEKEVNAFVAELHDALAYKDPLHRELFADLVRPATFEKAFAASVRIAGDSAQAIDKEFGKTRKLLKRKLKSEEYHRFFVSLSGTGMKVAKSEGGVSPQEAAALVVFLKKFSVDVAVGNKALARL